MTPTAGAEANLPDEALPEAANRRLTSGAWTSGLSVTDFASCLDMGMQPLGYVQGYAVMQWSWYMATGGFGFAGGSWNPPSRQGQYVEQWRCPHGFVSAEHRLYGMNYELTWLEQSWATGWGLAMQRMVDEAIELGATGVIGVVDEMRPLAGGGTVEFRASGTAIGVDGAPRPNPPFTTYLSGQRLGKLFEAGFAPVAVAATMASVRMLGYCLTHYQLAGAAGGSWYGASPGGVSGVGPIDQVNRAQAAARRLARERIRSQLGADVLHGATFEQFEREIGEGDLSIQCTLKGSRVRPFKAFDPLPEPRPVVRLSDPVTGIMP